MTESDKHTSLLRYIINYDLAKFNRDSIIRLCGLKLSSYDIEQNFTVLNDNLFQFHTFMISLLQFSKIFSKILDSFTLQKFWTRNLKLMAKDKKVNIAVTQL
jgi:hypothetical protein